MYLCIYKKIDLAVIKDIFIYKNFKFEIFRRIALKLYIVSYIPICKNN